jgi:signal transduction histidine kinase
MVLPISRPGGGNPFGFLVAGLSPRLALDDDYRGFLGLVADQIAISVGNARAHDEEKQRAAALAEIDRAKTTFFSNVSHEFRTPLTLMLGPIEDGLADEQEPLSARQRERHEIVRRNGLRLQKLVNTLLDFTRVEAGRAQAAFLPTDLAALTVDLASSFDSAFARAGLRFVCDCPPLPAPVAVDPAMWEKIVLNLLSNALKFTFEGQVRLSLRWHGDHVELRVEDTGTGIPPEELPRIFDRFHRVEGARGRSHEGTGIGLALVRELVKLHGGQVTVQSSVGQGSSFGVSLPTGRLPVATERPSDLIAPGPWAEPGPGPEPEPAPTRLAAAFLAEVAQWNASNDPAPRDRGPAASTSPPAASGSCPGARILVADDNPDMRAYLERLLSRHW